MEIKYSLVTHADRIAQISNKSFPQQEGNSYNSLEIIVGVALLGIVAGFLIYDFYNRPSEESKKSI